MTPGVREALSLYSAASANARMHLRIRAATCPLEAIADALPREGRILEIGCGHGLFAALLATRDARREIVGVDPVPERIQVADSAARALAARERCNLRFEVGDDETHPKGPFDAIAIVDLLYLLRPERQERLLRRVSREVVPGGRLVLKTVAEKPRWKQAWSHAQEWLAVSVFRITRGEGIWYLAPERLAGWLGEEGLQVEHRSLDRGFTHPHHLILARRPAPAGA